VLGFADAFDIKDLQINIQTTNNENIPCDKLSNFVQYYHAPWQLRFHKDTVTLNAVFIKTLRSRGPNHCSALANNLTFYFSNSERRMENAEINVSSAFSSKIHYSAQYILNINAIS